jgi:hypothetical protein
VKKARIPKRTCNTVYPLGHIRATGPHQSFTTTVIYLPNW